MYSLISISGLPALAWLRRSGALVMIVAGSLMVPLTAAQASGGGGGGKDKPPCIWEKDLILDVDGHEIQVTQETIRNGKVQENAGYFVRPDPRGLFLFVRTPEGATYRTGLTLLEIGKGRDACQVFYAGRMTELDTGRN